MLFRSEPLRDFLLKVSPLSEEALVKRLSLAGRVKMIVVSGIFINEDESRADLLLVSDRPDEKRLKKSFLKWKLNLDERFLMHFFRQKILRIEWEWGTNL